MWILTVYILIVVIMELIVVAIGLALDRIYPSLSLTISLSLFFAVLWLGWVVAVRAIEPRHVRANTGHFPIHSIPRWCGAGSVGATVRPRFGVVVRFSYAGSVIEFAE